ncbi:MAG: NTP transferase domain-containing protein [Actinomycetia bacterium]|nr:NTP transferase domain-containing protein [Actinomycetes bacterium]
MVAIVPIRGFDGMSRLDGVLTRPQRQHLARLLADRVVSATTSAGLTTMVVTRSNDVWSWAITKGLAVGDDPGTGLSDAAASGVASAEGHPWLVIHADLPLVTSEAIDDVATIAERSTVLVPSSDGGSSVIGGFGRFPFSYGPGSFHRHLAAVPSAVVVPSPMLSVDIDTPAHPGAFPELMAEITQ